MTPPVAPSLSTSDRARLGTIEELARAGSSSVGELILCLDDPSWTVRRAAVAALAALGDPAVGPLVGALASRQASETRLAALVDALAASHGAPEPALEALGAAADVALVCDAAQILGRRRSARSIAMLARWVAHEDDNVAVAAMEALSAIGGAAGLEAIILAASSGVFFRVFAAIDVLARCGDPRAIAPLTALLGHASCGLEAARALGRTGDLGAAQPLAAWLVSANEHSVRAAVLALVEIEDHQTQRWGAADAMLKTLRGLADPDAAARRIARCFDGAVGAEAVALCRALGWLGAEPAAATLVGLLGREPAIARAAAAALRRLGDVGARQVRAALRHGDSEQRALLLPLVAPHFDATPDVMACLDDLDSTVRRLACDALGRIGNVSAVPALFACLADSDLRVAQSAMGALHGLGSEETERRALRSARDLDSRVRRAAVRLIGYFGWPSGLESLVAALSDPDERVRDAAIHSLPLIEDPRALEALLALCANENARARAWAMRAVGHTHKVPATLAVLTRGLADADAWVRYYACQALGRLRAEEAIDALLALLDDPAGQVRVAVIEALASLGDERAVEALILAAGAGDPDAQRAALLGLGISRSSRGLPAIVRAVSATDASTRVVALHAVSAFDTAEAERVLFDAASDVEDVVRAAALGFLGARVGMAATARLVGLLDDETAREGALAALSIEVRGRIPGLLAALEEADGPVAERLVAALARVPGRTAGAALGVALVMERVAVRRAAAAALGARACPELAAALELAASGDPDAEVRRLATVALACR